MDAFYNNECEPNLADKYKKKYSLIENSKINTQKRVIAEIFDGSKGKELSFTDEGQIGVANKQEE